MNDSRIKSRPVIILAGIILSILMYVLIASIKANYFTQNGANELSSANDFLYSRLTLWGYLLLVYVYVIKVERGKFLLWSEKKSSLTFSLVSIALILLSIVLVIGVLSKIETYYGLNNNDKLKMMLQLLWKNKLLLLFTTISAGVIEELLFRGYLMPRLQVLLNKSWLTVTISTLLFALAHYSYGNWSQIINPFVIGLIFAIHYQKYKNIKVLMLCHFLIDFLSIITIH